MTASDPASRLSRLETQIFSGEYRDESPQDRLNRLESSVFGAAQSGETSVRLKRLEKTLRPYEEDEDSKTPATQNASTGEPSDSVPYANPINPAPAASFGNDTPQGPDATDYPTVTALERIVFSRDFIRDPLANRLSRIEQKVYGRTYPNLALVDRVDNLLMRYPEASIGASKGDFPSSATRPAGGPQTSVTDEDFYARRQSPPGSDERDLLNADIYTKLEVLERNILGPSQRQSGKLLTDRLDALERKTFGYSQMGTLSGRLDKLLQARSGSLASQRAQEAAERNARDYNTMTQMQSSQAAPTSAAPNPNIQIGMGVSSNSQYQFSQDMLNLLPNDVRSQMMNGQAQSLNSGGTVSMTETVTQPGGYYQLPNGMQGYTPPQQYQNTYQLTPLTLPAPTGQPLPPPPGMLPDGQIVNNQPINGNEMQTLAEMENTVFGHINASDPIELRLWRLESHMSGQTYGGYPLQQRLENLHKIYQYQYLGTLLQQGQEASPKAVPNTWDYGQPTPPAH